MKASTTQPLSGSVSPTDLDAAMHGLFALVPPAVWERRARNLLSRWSLLGAPPPVIDHHKLELGIAEAVARHAEGKGFFPADWAGVDGDLVAFVHVLQHLVNTQPHPVRDYCLRKLDDGVGGSRSLRAFALELRTFLHAANRGFAVQPIDMLGAGRHDFTAMKGGKEIALECKHVDGDTGMVITPAQAAEAVGLVWRRCSTAIERLPAFHLHLQLPDAKAGPFEWAEMMGGLLMSGQQAQEADEGWLRYSELSTLKAKTWEEGRTRLRGEPLQAFAVDLFGISTQAHVIAVGSEGGTAIFTIDSDKRRSLLSSLFDRLRADAKKQLPHDRPGAFIVGLSSLLPIDDGFFLQHDAESPIHRQVVDLFQRRPHVLAITFTSGSSQVVSANPGASDTQLGLRSLSFVNPDHAARRDEDFLDLVRLKD